jgi:hypothetical protein
MLQRYFEYLEELRASGQINMMGAIPYLMDEFDLTRAEAMQVFKEWMQSKKE